MIRKLFRSFLLTFISGAAILPSKAQVVNKDYASAAVQALMKGNTYVVLTTDSTFNKWLHHALEEVWTVSKLTYITTTELDSFVKSDKNVFLFAQSRDDRGAAFHLVNGDDMSKKKEFTVILSQGGFHQTKYLFTPATSGPKIIGYFRYAPERAEVTAGMIEGEMLLAFMNQSLQIVIDNKVRGSVRDSIWDHIYIESPQIKDKTMIFNKAYSDGTIILDKKVLLTDKLIEDYPYTNESMSPDSVKQMLNEEPGNYCYLFLYYPSAYVKQTHSDDSGDILVYDAAQKKLLYYDDNLSGPWLEKSEFKDMLYAIKSGK